MEKIGDLMRQLGFREDASDETKKAFIRNLVKAAYPQDVSPGVFSGPATTRHAEAKEESRQLSFCFEEPCQIRKSG